MECSGNQGMRTNGHSLILGAFALKSLVLSDRTVVDIIVDPVAISNLIMTEGHDTCVRPGLLASSEGLIECEDIVNLFVGANCIVELDGGKKRESKPRLGANGNYAAFFTLVTSFHTRKRSCKMARYSPALKW